MPASQRSLILAAFADSHTTFCPGERLIVAGIPNQPQIRVTPPSLSDKDLLIAALRGLLTDVSFPAEIEIRCRP